MSFLPSLGRDATLPELFKAYPATARKRLPFEEEVMRGPSPLSAKTEVPEASDRARSERKRRPA